VVEKGARDILTAVLVGLTACSAPAYAAELLDTVTSGQPLYLYQ
jgi:hypothetical protein